MTSPTADGQGWRPIESAPRDGSYVLAYPVPSFVNGIRVNLSATMRYSLGSWCCVRSGWKAAPSVWQPLPSPPTSGEAG